MPPQKTFATSVIAGGVAGSVAKTALAPLERARILLQVGRDDRGFVAAMRRVARDEGARGLWAGNAASVARVFPARGIAFASNDALRPLGAGRPAEWKRARRCWSFATASLAKPPARRRGPK